MENTITGSEPITPCIHTRVSQTETRLRKEGDSKDYQIPMPGLTIRQHFAGLAMQGLMSLDTSLLRKPTDVAIMSVACADALIAELNKALTQ